MQGGIAIAVAIEVSLRLIESVTNPDREYVAGRAV
jgi:hypothetical protein